MTAKERRERLVSILDRVLIDAARFGFTAPELFELVEERVRQFQWNEAARTS